MGVIDLDKRVKKLEQEGAGGAVIDQLEAAVTALEETVNGNGETDFGLVGDVAALEEAAVPVKTEITEPTTGTAITGGGGIFYEVMGNVVHIHVGVQGITANTIATIFTLPEAVRPAATVRAAGQGTDTFSSASEIALMAISVSGGVSIISGTQYAICDVVYLLNETT